MMPKKRCPFCALDAILLCALAAALGLFLWRVHLRFDYAWNWAAVPQFLLRHDPESGWVPNVLLRGLFTTIRLSIWSTALALLAGVLAGLAGASRSLFLRLLARTYVETMRNLPPLVLVFIFYFFIYALLAPLTGLEAALRNAGQWSPWVVTLLTFLCDEPARLPGFISGVITLAVYEGAYIAEIVRGGIASVDRGQWEAASSLGLGRFSRLRLVILPQALKVIIPPLAGQFISTIKDSAIVSIISIPELTFQGLELMAATYLTFEVWITVTCLYLALTLGCAMLARRLESRLRWRF